jgi:hypothetical protein
VLHEDALPWYRKFARTACNAPVGNVYVAESGCVPPAGGTIVPMNTHVGLFALAA